MIIIMENGTRGGNPFLFISPLSNLEKGNESFNFPSHPPLHQENARGYSLSSSSSQ